MKTDVYDMDAQAWMEQEEVPEFAPNERIREFETETDAINYSVDQAIRNRRGFTHMELADNMRMNRAVLTKMRQGQVGVPVSKFVTFIRATGSFALLQYYATQFGLVLKDRQEENAARRKMQRLEAENAEFRRLYSNVIGRDEG